MEQFVILVNGFGYFQALNEIKKAVTTRQLSLAKVYDSKEATQLPINQLKAKGYAAVALSVGVKK